MIRRSLLAVMLLAIGTRAHAADDGPSSPVVDFDTGLSFACRDVTPKAFAEANPSLRVVEVPLRISASFLTSEKNIEAIIYEIRVPQPLEIKDYLPQTKLATDIEELVKKQSTASHSGLTVTSQGNAKIGYTIPGVLSAEAGVSGGKSSEASNQVSSGVEAKVLPPKQAIIAAFTKDRRQTLCFKLRPFSLTTLEEEKEFAMILTVPKDWQGEVITLDCTAWQADYKATLARESMAIALYREGADPAVRARYETLARGRNPAAATPAPAVASAPAPAPEPAKAPAAPVGNAMHAKYAGKYVSRGSVQTWRFHLAADGTYEMRTEALAGSSLTKGMWSADDNTLVLMPKSSRHSVFGDIPVGGKVINEAITSFDPERGILRTKSYELLPDR